jgi:5-methylcytosine-specific restriction endonuclease McrA
MRRSVRNGWEHEFVSRIDDRNFRCSRCREVKPASEFSMRGSSGGRPDTYCRPCRSEYGKEHYAANRQRYIEQTRVRNQKRFRERVSFLLEYSRSHPCTDCGESDPVVLDFDHLRDKAFHIAYGIHYRAWDQVLAEIEKCEVVCSNCHRRRTARRRGTIRLLLSEPN